MRQNRPNLFLGTSKLNSFNTWYGKDNIVYVELDMELPLDNIANIQKKIDILSQEISKELKQPVKVKINLDTFQQLESQLD